MVGLIDISFKEIGDFQFHSLFVTYRDSLLTFWPQFLKTDQIILNVQKNNALRNVF